jgi:hypothetical protein
MRTIIKLICPNANCNGHIDRKVDFENKSVNVLSQEDPIDMEVVCQAAKEENFEELA